MAVKPAPGETLRQTIDTQVIPTASLKGNDRKLSDGTELPIATDFWEWIESCPIRDLQKWEAEINLYRGNGVKRDVLCEQLHYPPDEIRFSRRWVKDRFGGGEFNVMVKLEKQLRFNTNIRIEGLPKEPKDIDVSTPAQTSFGNGELGTMCNFLRDQTMMVLNELRAARGGDAGQDAVRQAVNLTGEAYRSAVTNIREAVAPSAPAPAANPMEALYAQFMTAMIQKMLNPADPIEQFTKMLGAMQGIPGFSAGGGNANTSVVQDIIRALPAVVQSGAALMGNLARGKEAELRYFEQARAAGTLTAPPQLPGHVAPAQPGKVEVLRPRNGVAAEPKAPEPGPHAQPAAADPAPPANDPNAPPVDYGEHVEERIANIVLRDIPVKDAAYQVLIYLDMETGRPDGTSWVDNMLAAGEEVLLGMFSSRRILTRVPQNPRLTEFVKEFLDQARQSRAPEPSAPQQTEPPQPSA